MSIIKNSASINIEEKEVRKAKIPTVDATKTGGILPSNWGYAKKLTHINDRKTLVESFGKPNKFNYKDWFNSWNYFTSDVTELYLIRPLPANAKNNSYKLNGNYATSNSKTQNQPINDLYNTDVAKFTIEQLMNLSDSEIEIINRYVSTKENVAFSICSSEDHWNQAISNEEILSLRNIGQKTTPNGLVNFEGYQVETYKFNISTLDGIPTTSTIVIENDADIVEKGDLITITGSTTETANNEHSFIVNNIKLGNSTGINVTTTNASNIVTGISVDLTSHFSVGEKIRLVDSGNSDDAEYTILNISYSTNTTIILDKNYEGTGSATTATYNDLKKLLTISGANLTVNTGSSDGVVELLKGEITYHDQTEWSINSIDGTVEISNATDNSADFAEWKIVEITGQKTAILGTQDLSIGHDWSSTPGNFNISINGKTAKNIILNTDTSNQNDVKDAINTALLAENVTEVEAYVSGNFVGLVVLNPVTVFEIIDGTLSDFGWTAGEYNNNRFHIVNSASWSGGTTTITLKTLGLKSIDLGYGKIKLVDVSKDLDILIHNGSFFEKITPANNDYIYVDLKGATYTYNNTTKILSRNKLNYQPVDENKDGKSEYAVKKIYKGSLYNTNKSVKTFSEVFDKKPVFRKNEFALLVLLKDEDDNLYELVERHILSYDQKAKSTTGKTKFAENVILDSSSYVYIKLGSNEYNVEEITTTTIVLDNVKADHFEEDRTITISNANNSINNDTYDIESVSYDSGTLKTTITIKDDTLTAETPSECKVTFGFGQVSTNKSKYSNKRDTSYDSTKMITGYSIEELTFKEPSTSDFYGKDFSMVDTWEDGADYQVLKDTDLNEAAEIFNDTDNVDVQILMSFATKNANGFITQNKMAEIAAQRQDTLAIVAPFEEKYFLGKTNAEKTSYLVENFGNKREDLYSGTFTGFSSFSAVYGNMKLQSDTFNDKDVWLPVVGDIAGMLTNLDNKKGQWYALAGVENGLFLNSKEMAYNPNKSDRDTLSSNGINHIYYNKSANYPVIFEQVTSVLDDDSLFRELHVRRMLILLKDFLKEALLTKLFRNNTDYERADTLARIEPTFNRIQKDGGLEDFYLICDESNNTDEVINSNSLAVDIRIQPTKVVKYIDVSITAFDYGIDIREYEA